MHWNDVKKSLVSSFEDVKDAVRKTEGRGRAGLMLGLQELGTSSTCFVGAYYYMDSNMIIVNKTPLRRITESFPSLLEPYCFQVLLHEYIHSLGVQDEEFTREKTYDVCRKILGEGHQATLLAKDMSAYLSYLTYPGLGWTPQGSPPIEKVEGFDESNTRPYIS
jgi:hypothetical protein